MMVVLMDLDMVVIYPNHSWMDENLADLVMIRVATEIDLLVVVVTSDEVIEDLKKH